jgi:hypothetical protein
MFGISFLRFSETWRLGVPSMLLRTCFAGGPLLATFSLPFLSQLFEKGQIQ